MTAAAALRDGAPGRGLIWLLLGAVLCAAPARALDVKLWPLIDYHRDGASRSLHLLGPLFASERSADATTLALRPLFAYRRAAPAAGSRFTLLYPLFSEYHDAARTEYRFFGLITFRAGPHPDTQQWTKRFTIFPLVFYRSGPTRGTSLSILPFYANVPDLLGYRRVRMVAFPLYLHLEQPLVERTWAPFPFVSWTGGTVGSGFRLWPLYGSDREDDTDRFRYVLWPFYISDDRHFTRPGGGEHRLILFPFHARFDSPTRRTRMYALTFLTHTVDRDAHTDTWGFPWPFWVMQHDRNTGERTSLRLAPFYEDSRSGDLHRHFALWPLYRWRTLDSDAYRYRRDDVLLVLYRHIVEVQPAAHSQRSLRTLFPLYRGSSTDGEREWSTLAVLDALFPRNLSVRDLYAPLWQVYAGARTEETPTRWSLLWDLVSSDGTRVRYPVMFDLSH